MHCFHIFSVAFYLYFGLKIISAIIILKVDLDFKKPSKHVVKDFKSLLKQGEIVVFIIVIFISGNIITFSSSF